MSSDVFILSAARDADAPTAIRQAIELAGISPSQVQDAVFGQDHMSALSDVKPLLHAAQLSCPMACVVSSLRAIFFAAASILSDDAELVLIVGMGADATTTCVLASPEAVGRWNLLPRAHIAARSLTGPEAALRAAGVMPADINIQKSGQQAATLLFELLEELDAAALRWGMLSSSEAVLLVERV